MFFTHVARYTQHYCPPAICSQCITLLWLALHTVVHILVGWRGLGPPPPCSLDTSWDGYAAFCYTPLYNPCVFPCHPSPTCQSITLPFSFPPSFSSLFSFLSSLFLIRAEVIIILAHTILLYFVYKLYGRTHTWVI